MKKNWLTTAGGIMAGFSGIPVLAGVSHIAIPNWINVACFIVGAVGGYRGRGIGQRSG